MTTTTCGGLYTELGRLVERLFAYDRGCWCSQEEGYKREFAYEDINHHWRTTYNRHTRSTAILSAYYIHRHIASAHYTRDTTHNNPDITHTRHHTHPRKGRSQATNFTHTYHLGYTNIFLNQHHILNRIHKTHRMGNIRVYFYHEKPEQGVLGIAYITREIPKNRTMGWWSTFWISISFLKKIRASIYGPCIWKGGVHLCGLDCYLSCFFCMFVIYLDLDRDRECLGRFLCIYQKSYFITFRAHTPTHYFPRVKRCQSII